MNVASAKYHAVGGTIEIGLFSSLVGLSVGIDER